MLQRDTDLNSNLRNILSKNWAFSKFTNFNIIYIQNVEEHRRKLDWL